MERASERGSARAMAEAKLVIFCVVLRRLRG